MPRSVSAATLAIACAVVAAIATGSALLGRPEPLPEGLVGRYFATADFSGEPILERVDRVLSTETLAATPELRARSAFSVEWSGTLIVRRDGIHRFATKSDDGTWLWIDDQLVIDNGGAHSIRNVNGQIRLNRGTHRFRLRFSEVGGGYFLQVGHAGPLARIVHPAPLVPLTLTTGEWRLRETWPLALVALWYLTLVALGAVALQRGRRLPIVHDLAALWSDRTLRWIVAGGVLLSAAHIAYGVPAIPSFSGDELEPLDMLVSSRNGFRDWNLRWPPLHAFAIAAVLQPFAWAEALFDLSLRDDVVVRWMFLVVRGLSVAMLGVSLLLTFDGTRMLADRRAAYFATALLACSPLVVFFGALSNLETPHLFWVTASLWLFIKALRERETHWFALFGAAVGLSVAAKDQAYGYYLLAPVVLVLLVRRDTMARQQAWTRVLTDRRLWYVAVATLLALAVGHALPWRWDRFVNRLAVLVGPASKPYQMFAPTMEGQAALLAATAKSLLWAAGIPSVVAFVIGAAVCVRTGRATMLAAVLLPAITYYVGFLVVILYVYDRFLIGWMPIVAAIGGIGLAALSQLHLRGRAAGAVVAAAIVGVAIVNAAAMNVVFFRDPRHRAWQWLQQNMPCGSSVGVTFNGRYVPPLDCLDMWELTPRTVDGMIRWPQYLVLNEAYLQRFRDAEPGARFVDALMSGAAGYERVWRAESSPPGWAPLYWEGRFWNRREDIETTADKPLHAIEIWECVNRPGCDRPLVE